MTPYQLCVLGICFLACLILLARVTGRRYLNDTSGQWAEKGVVFELGNIHAINITYKKIYIYAILETISYT